MTYRDDPWKKFRYALESFERDLKALNYVGAFEAHEPTGGRFDRLFSDFFPSSGITPENVASLLAARFVGPPHGFDLLQPVPLPDVPKIPARPAQLAGQYDTWIVEKAEKLERQFLARFEQLSQQFQSETDALEKIRQRCVLEDPEAVIKLMDIALRRHPLPKLLRRPAEYHPDFSARLFLATIEVPNFANISIVRKRGSSWNAKPQLVSATERKRCLEAILYALAIRAAYLIANSDAGNWFDTIAVNVKQHWNDPTTGAPRDGLIASLQAMKSELATLQISSLEPKACFRHFKGISTPSVDQVAPIRPIFVMDTADDRVVKNRDVAEQMNEETNLAAMPWEDFEQLVRQLFEWEFGRNGVEVKVTRASRDRGVDAIMFDPDPLRGGKFVLQAKRYTRTVDVAAVRDLYGTIVNEGANRGILVTTASYGPDAYEFAKNKPISLVDGPNLIAILKRHARAFRIDLDEARRLNVQ
jgi:restriction system protein